MERKRCLERSKERRRRGVEKSKKKRKTYLYYSKVKGDNEAKRMIKDMEDKAKSEKEQRKTKLRDEIDLCLI